MSTLYESICHAHVEGSRLERQTKEECRNLAVNLISGIREELQAPQDALQLASPDERPDIGVSTPREAVMRRNGNLGWEFGFILYIKLPQSGSPLGDSWGAFTIRRKDGAYWGADEIKLSYPEPDHSVFRLFMVYQKCGLFARSAV